MQKPQFPIKGSYFVNQLYSENQVGYSTGKHGGIDTYPLAPGNFPEQRECYPVFSGKLLSAENTDKDRGKGIRVRTEIWPELASYLKEKGIEPGVYLDVLYWHLHEVTDLDGQIEQDTPLGIIGNTGNVWSSQFPEANGKLLPVPEKYKAVPPYYGLHLHLETRIVDKNGKILNLSKDPFGRIDPFIILNYKPQMTNAKLIQIGETFGYWYPVTHPEALKSQALNVGEVLPEQPDGSLDFSKIVPDYKI